MSKSTLTITVDSIVLKALNSMYSKRSEIVNHILSVHLLGEEGTSHKILAKKQELEKLELMLKQQKKQKQVNKKLLLTKYKPKLQKVKEILLENPNRAKIWVGLVNKECNTSLANEKELMELLEYV